MNEALKSLVRKTLQFLHLDLTKNLEYDRLTRLIIKQCLADGGNAIDIGCHKGEILDLFLKYSPNGKHYGFEPIPKMYEALQIKYNSRAKIFGYALSDIEGTTTFQFVKNAPAYSGIRKRNYPTANPDIEEINVEVKKLDSVISQNEKIDLIKIDVEGAELGVLKGSIKTILKNKPVIIFECGLGASDHYNTTPELVFNFLTNECRLNISTLKNWLSNQANLTSDDFIKTYNNNSDYYFIAAP